MKWNGTYEHDREMPKYVDNVKSARMGRLCEFKLAGTWIKKKGRGK